MSLACEAEVRVQNDNAVRMSIASKQVPILEYIKTISSLVGASHILAVFEESDSIKVFLDDKRHVDTLVRSGIHVLGHHVRMDYVIAPGTKLILSNVDPVISNYDIMRLLSVYGSVVSPVIRPPFSDDVELCHIACGIRYVYMELSGCIPNKLQFKYGEQLCNIKIRVDENEDSQIVPFIKTDVETNQDVDSVTTQSYDSVPGPSGIESFAISTMPDPILVSVESAVAETNSVEVVESSNNAVPVDKPVSSEPSIENNKVIIHKRRGRPPRHLQLKRKRITTTSQAATRIKKNVKNKWMKMKKVNHFKKGRRGRKPMLKLNSLASTITCHSSSSDLSLPDLEAFRTSNSNVTDIKNCVLEKTELLKFLDEVKHHRAPLELAKKYIGDDCDTNVLRKFIDQLNEFNMHHNDAPLKARLLRLMKSLQDALYVPDMVV